MVAVTTHGLVDFKNRSQNPPNIAPGIDEIGKLGFAPERYTFDVLGKSVETDNTPISLLPAAVVTCCGKSVSFLDDYYNRIHITPSFIDLGNLLSVQIREIDVWNAYLSPQLLSSIGESGTDGIVLTEPVAPPTTFAELESRIYTVNISTNGSPVIDAVYTFNFPLESPTLSIIGRRVVVWPFVPQTKHREQLEWKTDILRAFSSEQRLALRVAPRQAFTYNFQLDPRQFSRAKAIATQWSHRVYGIPVWSEATYVGAVNAGAIAILFDTAYADYRDNDIILLWESDTNFVALENLDVLADRINLKLPLENSYTNAYVIPLRFARTLRGLDFKRSSNDVIVTRGDFTVTANADLGASVGYDVYRGKDVIPSRTVLVSDVTERINRAQDIFDNGSGPIQVDIQTDWIGFNQEITFDTLDRQKRWEARQWIHSRRGKQKSFWLPSWNEDLVSLVDVASDATSLTVLPIGYPLYYGVKDIRIELVDGTVVYNRILGATTDGDGNEILALENPVGVELLVSNINYICFMSHVRFNTDSVDFAHDYAGRATTTIAVVETPES